MYYSTSRDVWLIPSVITKYISRITSMQVRLVHVDSWIGQYRKSHRFGDRKMAIDNTANESFHHKVRPRISMLISDSFDNFFTREFDSWE